MNKIVPILLAMLIFFSGISAYAHMSEEAKIDHLLASVKQMPEGTRFMRNGKEYGSGKAAEHLRMKYARGKKHAGTAKLFIENIASKSSLTGIEYRIRFVDGSTVTTREFFLEQLKKIEKKEEAPESPQGR
jgi:hypothetical protein